MRNLVHDGEVIFRPKDRPSDDHFIKDKTQREDIRPGSDGNFRKVFGGHITGGSGKVFFPTLHALGHDGYSEIHDLGRIFLADHDIGGAHIPVHDSQLMGAGNAIQDLSHNIDRARDRERAFISDQIAQGPAVHKFKDQIGSPVSFSGLIDRNDIRMLKPSDGFGLLDQTLLSFTVSGRLKMKGFDGDSSFELGIGGKIDDAL